MHCLYSKTYINIRDYLMITLGLLLYVCAWKGFLLPHKVVGGGATGIAALLYYSMKVPMWISYFLINLGLLIASIKILGWSFSIRTVYGVLVLTLFFAVIPEASIGTFVSETDSFMACVIGGIVMGTGAGIIFANNGSSGGTDIIAKLVNKYRNITLGRMILYSDVLVVCSSILLKDGSIERIVYGLTTLVISTLVIDMVIDGVRQSVQFLIISRNYDQIAQQINQIPRGVTVVDGVGWYSKEPVKVLFVLARKNESIKIFRLVKSIDPQAFISQSLAIGVYGNGFDVIKSK